jgi:hypothetical protein
VEAATVEALPVPAIADRRRSQPPICSIGLIEFFAELAAARDRG